MVYHRLSIYTQDKRPLDSQDSLLHPCGADFAAVAQGAGGRQTDARRRTQLT